MPRIVLALAGLVAAAMPAMLPAQAISSRYTDFDLGRCRELSAAPDEGDSASYRCPGLGRHGLLVATSDLRFDVDVGADDRDFQTAVPFNTIGPRFEWRMRGGQPIALVYRLVFSTSEQPIPSVLVVKAIRPDGRSGCITGFVLGSLPDANVRARRLADQARSFRCEQQEPPLVGFNW